jgi:serine/threonine-protein kinase ULK3
MAKISDYELLQVIGSGTYATVHKAIDKRTRQLCAIKIMDRKRFLNEKTDNLIREIEILKKLNHRYIVQLYDFGSDSKNVYIIMELCDTSLSTFIRSRKALAESTCRYFIRSLAEAIKYMRENNISHFDLKPQNLLLKRPKPNANYMLKVAGKNNCDFFNN